MNTTLPTRFALALAACTLIAGGAQAAQKTSSVCNANGPGGNQVSTAAGSAGIYLSDLIITVNNNSGAAKKALVTFSADIGVDANSELRLLYSLDGGAPFYAGPQNIANNAEFYEARSATASISVPPGSHTIQPYLYVSGATGKLAVIDDRCMAVTF